VTVRPVAPEMPPSVAEMVVVPTAPAVASPVALMVATAAAPTGSSGSSSAVPGTDREGKAWVIRRFVAHPARVDMMTSYQEGEKWQDSATSSPN
jgi:hypothetical protein